MASRRTPTNPLWLIILAEIAVLLSAFVLNEINEVVELKGLTLAIVAAFVVILNISLFFYQRHRASQTEQHVPRDDIYSDGCGDEPLDLERERLFISTAVGTYFASLLESPVGYISIPDQIQCQIPNNLKALSPFQSVIHRLNERRGIDVVVIAADAGMGKSTLAAKIIRCLYSRRYYDRILGDSAKSEVVEFSTAETRSEKPGFVDPATFYQRLAEQLGITEDLAVEFGSAKFIRDSIAGMGRTLVVIDNLEDIEEGSQLLKAIKEIVGADIKAIITTRKMFDVGLGAGTLVVNLNPITQPQAVIQFALWHIDNFAETNPGLEGLRSSINRTNAKLLVQKSGGVPLVMQLLLSDVVDKTWAYLEQIPHIEVSHEMLEYLYRRRWQELHQAAEAGALALDILRFIANRQERRQRTYLPDLVERFGQTSAIGKSIELLRQHFLLVARPATGEFVIYPVLVQFIHREEGTPTSPR